MLVARAVLGQVLSCTGRTAGAGKPRLLVSAIVGRGSLVRPTSLQLVRPLLHERRHGASCAGGEPRVTASPHRAVSRGSPRDLSMATSGKRQARQLEHDKRERERQGEVQRVDVARDHERPTPSTRAPNPRRDSRRGGAARLASRGRGDTRRQAAARRRERRARCRTPLTLPPPRTTNRVRGITAAAYDTDRDLVWPTAPPG